MVLDNLDRGANLTLLTYPSVDALEEFKLLRSNYSPEFGRNSGGQINAVTRSGGRDFHGGVFEFFRNDVLAANNFFNNFYAVPRPPIRYNNFGFTIGGPVYMPGVYNANRKKTFFFYSQEWRCVIDYSTFLSRQMPTPEELQGILPQEVCTKPVFDPDTGACIGPTTTEITNFDPTALAYIKDIYSKLPVPAPDGTIASTGRNVYNFREELFRVDHVFNPNLSAFVRCINDYIPTEEPSGLFTGSNLPGVATTHTNAPGNGLAVHATFTFSPTLLNEAGYGYSYGAVDTQPVGLNTRVLSPDVRPNLAYTTPASRIPNLYFATSENIIGFGPWIDKNANQSAFDTLIKTAGKHSLRFGVSYNHHNKEDNPGEVNNGAFGFYSVDPTGVSTFAQEWANFLIGNVESFSQNSTTVLINTHQNNGEFFAQDEYRILRNLTITYGFRWSLFRQPTDSNNSNTAFDPALFDPTSAPEIDGATGLLVPGTETPVVNGIIVAGKTSPFGNAIASQSNKDIAPRVGLAWDPFHDGKTAVRAGYGVFFDSPPLGSRSGFFNPPTFQYVSISNTNLTNPTDVAFGTNLVPGPLFSPSPDWNTPYSQEWSLDIQRQFMPSILLDVGYFGNKGTHLLGAREINQPRPGAYLQAGLLPQGPITPETSQLLNSVRPYRGYGPINFSANQFDSNYHSLQVRGQLRFGQKFEAVVNYTLAHALGNMADDFAVAQNSYDLRAEYGPTNFDRRHIFTARYIYRLPSYPGPEGFVGRLLNGWELSGVVFASSGPPISVSGLNPPIDPAGLGLFAPYSFAPARPDRIGDPNKDAPRTVNQWFNTSAFANPTADGLRPGNAPVNSIRGPGEIRWDAAVLKRTKFKERFNLEFRVEATNVLNHTNFDLVVVSFGNPQFGQVRGTRDPRILQLGIKLNF